MIHRLLRTLLGLVFLGTGTVKLMDMAEFSSNLADFGIVLDSFVPATAWLITFAELGVGIGLLASARWSLAGAVMMLVLFVSVLAYGIALGLDIDCGCFGTAFSVDLRTQLLIDIGLIGYCGLVYVTGKHGSPKNTEPEAAVVSEGEV